MSHSRLEELETINADHGDLRNGTHDQEEESKNIGTPDEEGTTRAEGWDSKNEDLELSGRQNVDDVTSNGNDEMTGQDEDHGTAEESINQSTESARLSSSEGLEENKELHSNSEDSLKNTETILPNPDDVSTIDGSIDKSEYTKQLSLKRNSEFENETSQNSGNISPAHKTPDSASLENVDEISSNSENLPLNSEFSQIADEQNYDKNQDTDRLLSTISSEEPNSKQTPIISEKISAAKEPTNTSRDTDRLLSRSSSEYEKEPQSNRPPKKPSLSPDQLARGLKKLKEERDREQEISILASTDIGTTGDNIPPAQLFLNFLMAYFWIGPQVVIFWVSTWMIISTIIIVPHRPTLSAWSSAAIGYGIFFITSCAQDKIRDFAYSQGKVTRYVISRVYTYVIAIASINQWRSIWDLWEIYTGVSPLKGMAYSLTCFFLLCLLRCCRQALAPPACIALDFPLSSYFEMSTYRKMRVGSLKQVLDTLFTVVVVATLVIGVWRGLWEVFDTAFYPDAPNISAAFNMLMSYSMAIFLILTRKYMKTLAAWAYRKHWLLQLVIEDFITMMHVFCCITHWRGYWVLYDFYILQPPTRYYVGHGVCFVLLASVIASNSLLVRGCARDGQLPNGEAVMLDFHYVTNMIHGYRRRQRHKATLRQQQGNGDLADKSMLAQEMDEALERKNKEQGKSLIV